MAPFVTEDDRPAWWADAFVEAHAIPAVVSVPVVQVVVRRRAWALVEPSVN